jgi:hypothetical protein
MKNEYVFRANAFSDFNVHTDLSPVMSEDGINYRVPVQVAIGASNKYVVHVGNMLVRVFTDDTLPDFIRVRLSMIKASDVGETLNKKLDDILTTLELFRTRHGNLETVGWQAASTMFIVVMSHEELISLKGMA